MKPQETFDQMSAEFLTDPRIVMGKMFGSVGLKIGGKVFAILVKEELVLKLPKERVAAIVAAGSASYFDPGHGRKMKEWVALRPTTHAEWIGLARKAMDFVNPESKT